MNGADLLAHYLTSHLLVGLYDLDSLLDGLGLLFPQSLSLLQVAQNCLLSLSLFHKLVVPHFDEELAITHNADISTDGRVKG